MLGGSSPRDSLLDSLQDSYGSPPSSAPFTTAPLPCGTVPVPASEPKPPPVHPELDLGSSGASEASYEREVPMRESPPRAGEALKLLPGVNPLAGITSEELLQEKILPERAFPEGSCSAVVPELKLEGVPAGFTAVGLTQDGSGAPSGGGAADSVTLTGAVAEEGSLKAGSAGEGSAEAGSCSSPVKATVGRLHEKGGFGTEIGNLVGGKAAAHQGEQMSAKTDRKAGATDVLAFCSGLPG